MNSTTAPSAVREMEDYVSWAVKVSDGLSIKERLGRAAEMLGLEFGKAQAYWYSRVRRVDADEADQVRGRVQYARLERLKRLEREYEAARNEFLATAPASMVRLAPPPLPAREDQGRTGADEDEGVVRRRASGGRG